MKVEHANITPLITKTCQDLETLKKKIGEDVSNVNNEELKTIIQQLHTEANQLTREIMQSKDIAPLDAKLMNNLTSLIDTIRHMSTATQALGAQQALLFGVFQRLSTCIKKFESKVTKVENDPLR